MTAQPDLVRQSDLINQMVLDRNTMTELGRVEVLWMYPQAHRVLGFICKSGLLGMKKSAFKLIQLHALGSNGILTHSQPEATDAERVGLLESLLQHEVWTDQGNRVGKITDYVFDLKTGNITHYLLVSSGWGSITGEIYQLTPAQILSFGQKRVLVQEAIVPNLTLYREGLRQKLTEVSEFLQEEATQEWRSITRRAENVTEETKERLQELTEQSKERAQRLSQTAREQAKTLNQQWQEESQTWIERLKSKGQIAARQLKKQTHHFSRQVEDSVETIIVQAEEIFDPKTQVSKTGRQKTEASEFFDPEFFDSETSDSEPATTAPETEASQPQPDQPQPWQSARPTDRPSPTQPLSEPAFPNPRFQQEPDEDDDDDPWI